MNPPRLLLLLTALLLFSCSQPSDLRNAGLLDAEFESFQLLMSDNPGLAFDVTGRQDGQKIYLEYPDFSLPGFHWIPSFSTAAASVEVAGDPQISGSSLVDFSGTVVYTLTASSGQIQQFEVELIPRPGWQDMGTNPLLAALFPSSISTGFLHDLNPFVVALDNASVLRAYALDLIDGQNWNEFIGGPAGVEVFDSLYWDNQIWTVYRTAGPGGNIELRSCVPPNTWSGIQGSIPYNSAEGLHLISSEGNKVFTAWIDDAQRAAVVWYFELGFTLQLGGSLAQDAYGENFQAESFRAVSNGGGTIYGACTFREAPGLLHLFKISEGLNSWQSVHFETAPTSDDWDRIIVDMFYDSAKQAPVILLRSRDHDVGSSFKISFLYFDQTASLWTDLNYVDPFYIPESDISSLSVSWYENSPSAAFGNRVIHWEDGLWKSLGDGHSLDKPSVQSLSRGVLDTSLAAFRDEGTGDLIVRFYQ